MGQISVNGATSTEVDENGTPIPPVPDQKVIAELGLGVLSVNGDFRAQAIDISGEYFVEETLQDTEWTISLIESREQLREVLDIAASASYSELGMSAGASASLYRRSDIDQYSFMLVVRTLVKTKFRTFRPDRRYMIPALLTAVENKQYSGILRRIGDEFIEKIVYGGEYIAAVRVQARTSDEYQETKTQAQAAVGRFDAEGSFAASFQRIASLRTVEAIQIVEGVLEALPAWDKVEEYSRAFPARVKAAGGRPVLVATESLMQSNNWPFDDEIVLDVEQIQRRHDYLLDVSDDLRRLQSSWQRVAKAPEQFRGGNAELAHEKLGAIKELLKDIQAEFKVLLVTKVGQLQNADAEKQYDSSGLKGLPLALALTRRPRMTGSYIEGGVTKSEAANQQDTGPNGDANNWIRSAGGHAAVLTGFSLAFDAPPPDGIELWMQCQWGPYWDGPITGWAPAQQMHTNNGKHLSGIALELRGPLADLYTVDYTVHCNDVGNSTRHGNVGGVAGGPGTMAVHGGYPVQGARVVIASR